MRALTLVVAVAALSCHSTTSSAVGAAVMTPLAIGASAANRAAGGCYAVCQQGERCNPKNGLCEEIPCRGECSASETCEKGFWGDKCVATPPLAVSAKANAPPAPPSPPPEPAEKKEVPPAAIPK